MQSELKREIAFLARKKLSDKVRQLEKDRDYRNKFEKRSGRKAPEPSYSQTKFVDKHFDPKHCLRNKNLISKSMWRSCQELSYKPKPSILVKIPKPDGSFREIMEFTIPDAALSRVMYRRLTARNIKKQSSDSYAYRPDRTLFDALLRLSNSIGEQKTFISEYDFKAYFDSIPHHYLTKLIENPEIFTTTKIERSVLKSFLQHQFAEKKDYLAGNFSKRKIGTPQGSSISLLLANLANDPLDKSLEKLNGQFVRYADDVVNITYNYEDALRVENAFFEHCSNSGIQLNIKKSKGISVLSKFGQELRNSESFNYLGYKISKDQLEMSDKAVENIKQKISDRIHIYLHRHPRSKNLGYSSSRAGPGYDWDLIGCVSEIRNIIYGGLTENRIKNS